VWSRCLLLTTGLQCQYDVHTRYRGNFSRWHRGLQNLSAKAFIRPGLNAPSAEILEMFGRLRQESLICKSTMAPITGSIFSSGVGCWSFFSPLVTADPRRKNLNLLRISLVTEVVAFYWTCRTPDIVNPGREEQDCHSVYFLWGFLPLSELRGLVWQYLHRKRDG